MTLIPQNSLAARVAEKLKGMISEGVLREWLPGERSLCQTLQVSHSTLRGALHILRKEGVVESRHGVGTRVAPSFSLSALPSNRAPSVGLLIPEAMRRLRPFSLWLDAFHNQLVEAGWRLKVHENPQHYRPNPSRILERLVASHSHACWVLVLSTPAMQSWFESKNIPCVLAGSCHAGISLPSVDVDHRAVSRHAAGVLLSAGHRYLALFNPAARHAGDQQTEMGFFEGVRQSPHADAAMASVVYHDVDSASVEKCLHRLFQHNHPQRPTALVISNAYAYLTAFSFLATRGLRVPGDISLISRDDDPFLDYLKPSPARYLNRPDTYARKLTSQVLDVGMHRQMEVSKVLLLPEYFPGQSVAAHVQS